MKSFLRDNTMELLELGQSTAKATKQGIKNTFSPLKMLQSMTQNPNAADSAKKEGDHHEKEEKTREALKNVQNKNSTSLDFDKLGEKYKDQEKQSLDAMRNKLFQLVKSDERQGIESRRREEQERLQKIQQEEEEKRRLSEQQHQAEAVAPTPQGKIRKTIGAVHKKKAQEAHQETKANRSKG